MPPKRLKSQRSCVTIATPNAVGLEYELSFSTAAVDRTDNIGIVSPGTLVNQAFDQIVLQSQVAQPSSIKLPVVTFWTWVSGTATNNGWIIYQLTTSDGNGFQFRSPNFANAADRPRLTVRYAQ